MVHRCINTDTTPGLRVLRNAPGRVYDDYIVISDIEVPDHDPAMLGAALLTAMRRGIKTLIIAGDFLATDNSSLNSWTETWAVGNQINYEGALGLALQILEVYVTWFDEIYLIEGNHDDRINRATQGEVWFGMLLREAQVRAEGKCHIQFSRYSYMYVRTSRGPVAIYHQDNFSKTPVKLAQQMYEAENGPDYDPTDLNPTVAKCHIIVTHTHLLQRGWSPDGYREMLSNGTCRDPKKTRYAARGANKHHEWVQGFTYSQRGFFYQVTRKGTDWVNLLGDLVRYAEVVKTQSNSAPTTS